MHLVKHCCKENNILKICISSYVFVCKYQSIISLRENDLLCK